MTKTSYFGKLNSTFVFIVPLAMFKTSVEHQNLFKQGVYLSREVIKARVSV